MPNLPPISEDRVRLIAAEEAEKRTRRHEQICVETTKELTKSIDNLWTAFDAFRGRLWGVALSLIAGLFVLVFGLVSYIWIAKVGGL